jgi:hypothetical protein
MLKISNFPLCVFTEEYLLIVFFFFKKNIPDLFSDVKMRKLESFVHLQHIINLYKIWILIKNLFEEGV